MFESNFNDFSATFEHGSNMFNCNYLNLFGSSGNVFDLAQVITMAVEAWSLEISVTHVI